MSNVDYAVMLITTVILMIGFMQFYFWCQRNQKRQPKTFNSKLDNLFPLKPWWVWIYIGIYFPVFVSTVLTFKDFREFNYIIFNFFALMVVHLVFFVYYPIVTPNSWRNFSGVKPSLALKTLQFVQNMDKNSNCFPSMHVSNSMLIACHLHHNKPELGIWVWTFPILISLSTLYTKQHYVYDAITGILLGALAWWGYAYLML